MESEELETWSIHCFILTSLSSLALLSEINFSKAWRLLSETSCASITSSYDGIADGIADGTAGGIADGTTDATADGTAGAIADGTAGGIADGIADGTTDGTTDATAGNASSCGHACNASP